LPSGVVCDSSIRSLLLPVYDLPVVASVRLRLVPPAHLIVVFADNLLRIAKARIAGERRVTPQVDEVLVLPEDSRGHSIKDRADNLLRFAQRCLLRFGALKIYRRYFLVSARHIVRRPRIAGSPIAKSARCRILHSALTALPPSMPCVLHNDNALVIKNGTRIHEIHAKRVWLRPKTVSLVSKR